MEGQNIAFFKIIHTKLYVEISPSISRPLMLWLLSHNQHAAAMSVFTLIP